MESRLQAKIIQWLRSRGAYVIKTGGIGTPNGCPDIIALYEGAWLALEIKSSKTAKFQPLQKATLSKLSAWGLVFVVYPENWPEVKDELEKSFF